MVAHNDEQLLKYDTQNYIRDLEDFPYHIVDGYEIATNKQPDIKDYSKIIVCGMGGSGIPGDVLNVIMKDSKIPVFTNKNYTLPSYADRRSLVFILSYSGNTEETIEAFREALRKGCEIITITSGGKLKDLAIKHNKVYVDIPSRHQPRAMIGYLFFSMLRVLVNAHILSDQKKEIDSLSEFLKNPIFKEKGKDLAKNIIGKVPLVYSSQDLYPAALRFKTQINENAKVHAFWNTFSEMNHNEIVGYTNMETDYHMIIFGSESDHPRIKKRYEICKKLIKAKGVDVTQMNLTGKSFLKQVFTAIHIGDWTSYYMALLGGIDPSPVDVIEDLKKKLKH